MSPAHDSLQLAAEAQILEGAAALLRTTGLRKRRVNLPGGSLIEVDGATPDMSAFVSVFARQGALQGGQKRKVALDVLKLITLRRQYPKAKLYLAFSSEAAKASITGWTAEAIAIWEIGVIVVPLDDDLRERLARTQAMQAR